MTRHIARGVCLASAAWFLAGSLALAQTSAQQTVPVTPLDLPIGRSFPIRADTVVTRVSIVNSTVADVIVVSDREVVINSLVVRRNGRHHLACQRKPNALSHLRPLAG